MPTKPAEEDIRKYVSEPQCQAAGRPSERTAWGSCLYCPMLFLPTGTINSSAVVASCDRANSSFYFLVVRDPSRVKSCKGLLTSQNLPEVQAQNSTGSASKNKLTVQHIPCGNAMLVADGANASRHTEQKRRQNQSRS